MEQAERLREQLLSVLAEDAHNTQRLMGRLDSIARESGIGAHAALLLILTRLAFDEHEAKRHWEAIVEQHRQLSAALGRDAGIRVAVLDYFMNVNRKLTQPTLIDVEMLDTAGMDAAKDALTGLGSARAFRTALQHELRRARRYRLKTAVILFDLDDFAATNREHGSLVGDRLLREAAILLSNKIRDIDIAARPGEDELALLLPETDRNGALLVAERYRRELEAFFDRRESDGRPVGLKVSAGVACYPDDASTPETVLERAARALYTAKATGKNSVQLYRPERRRFLRFELEPGRFEVEVFSTPRRAPGQLQNLSRNGILFSSPEALQVGEEIEIRLAGVPASDGAPAGEESGKSLRLRGQVVRLEELPPPASPEEGASEDGLIEDRFEIGVAFDLGWGEGIEDLLGFLEQVQSRTIGQG